MSMDIVDSQVHIWGADTPDRPTYYECITLFTEHLPWLKGEDLEWVMGRGVREWLGWR